MIEQTIQWHEAKQLDERREEKNKIEYSRLIDEIETSNPTCLNSDDMDYYASALNACKQRDKDYTSNEVRRIMLQNSGYSSLDIISSFGFENDDIIDFY